MYLQDSDHLPKNVSNQQVKYMSIRNSTFKIKACYTLILRTRKTFVSFKDNIMKGIMINSINKQCIGLFIFMMLVNIG